MRRTLDAHGDSQCMSFQGTVSVLIHVRLPDVGFGPAPTDTRHSILFYSPKCDYFLELFFTVLVLLILRFIVGPKILALVSCVRGVESKHIKDMSVAFVIERIRRRFLANIR